MLNTSLRPGNVMAGLVPANHVDKLRKMFRRCVRPGRVDGRDEPGHDGKDSISG